MIRNVYVILAGLIAVAVICTAGVILHSIGGYHIELTPIIATVGAAGGGSRSSVMSLATALVVTRR
ncbi:hypothetical protein [Pseudomonas aeruginosa]|uniref:hypothetical protein n=1 Tax=Pseudomonas aeruginosa TaxID=287 RepID=UPI0018721BA7|nr:hypothetical protein [Pseudomonas aeruginosa]